MTDLSAIEARLSAVEAAVESLELRARGFDLILQRMLTGLTLGPMPSLRCPKCGSTEVDSALSECKHCEDGVDETAHVCRGHWLYFACRACDHEWGGRWELGEPILPPPVVEDGRSQFEATTR